MKYSTSLKLLLYIYSWNPVVVNFIKINLSKFNKKKTILKIKREFIDISFQIFLPVNTANVKSASALQDLIVKAHRSRSLGNSTQHLHSSSHHRRIVHKKTRVSSARMRGSDQLAALRDRVESARGGVRTIHLLNLKASRGEVGVTVISDCFTLTLMSL